MITIGNLLLLASGFIAGVLVSILYTRQKRSSVSKTIEPVQESLIRYEQHLNSMEKDQVRAYGAITEKLLEMGRSQNTLNIETANLVKALRVPHVRGRWGEITLKRAAELSGMSEYCDFSEQLSSKGDSGLVRPDMVVTLPENRKIIIDSKVPLISYLDALEASEEGEKQERMRHHGQQVMKHINTLASKKYFSHISPSPEFVILFIPGENFFSAAVSHYPGLIEKGIEKGVILATPTTLIALLKAVFYSWKQKKSYENAREIRNLGVELFSRLSTMTDNMNRLGKDIEKCVAAYNRTVGSMETRVMSTAKKMEGLGISSKIMDSMEEISYSKTIVRQFNRHSKDNEKDNLEK